MVVYIRVCSSVRIPPSRSVEVDKLIFKLYIFFKKNKLLARAWFKPLDANSAQFFVMFSAIILSIVKISFFPFFNFDPYRRAMRANLSNFPKSTNRLLWRKRSHQYHP